MKEEEMQLAVLAEPVISLFLLTAAVCNLHLRVQREC